MTITICAGKDDYILIGSKDKRFKEAWGEVNRCLDKSLYLTMGALTDWCNNQLKEECLFEIGD